MTIKLPDDIIKSVNKDNWEELFDRFMIVETDEGEEYVWTPKDEMKEFIRKLVEDENEN